MTTKYNPFYRTEPKLIYVPERWGRLDQGEWVADSRFTPPPKPTSGEYLDARDLFHIAGTIGDGGRNGRTDVGKLEALLYLAGVFDLDRTNGPTGYFGQRLKLAVEDFQRTRGLAVDGTVRPGGETIRTLARHLQRLGRRGDTVLAHITPEEARFLHQHTDGGSINPATGLMEFNDGSKKKGTYIWRTAGDDKVRPSHAEREGQVFSWDNPPDGGHPGEAPNCRCTAEDVKDDKCEKILTELKAAWRRHDALHKPILDAQRDVAISEKRLADLEEERSEIRFALSTVPIPGRPSKITRREAAATGTSMALLQQRLEEIGQEIEREEQTLATAKEKLAALEREQNNHRSTALELERRYKECIEKR